MTPDDDKAKIKELCELIGVEKDGNKLCDLITELNRLLERLDRVRSQDKIKPETEE